MIARLVKMSFATENVEKFLSLFAETKDKIRRFAGCEHLELLQDTNQANVYYTYSLWVHEEALENYRKSELFKEVWDKTKSLFNDKPSAHSMRKIDL